MKHDNTRRFNDFTCSGGMAAITVFFALKILGRFEITGEWIEYLGEFLRERVAQGVRGTLR